MQIDCRPWWIKVPMIQGTCIIIVCGDNVREEGLPCISQFQIINAKSLFIDVIVDLPETAFTLVGAMASITFVILELR